MKPTQEQIEAALNRVENSWLSSDQASAIMDYARSINSVFCNAESMSITIAGSILAAAYREAMAENERLQGKLSASNFVAAIPPHEIICTRCGLREERGEKPSCDF